MQHNQNEIGADLLLANSAVSVSAIRESVEQARAVMDKINRENVKKEATIVAGAEASVAQRELLKQQVNIVLEQNKLLENNYRKLEQMYDAQVQANRETKDELLRTKKYNGWMMVISIVAMLATVVSPIITLWVS